MNEEWTDVEQFMNEGAKNNYIDGERGGISALWILQFYGKTELAEKLKKNCDENEEIKTEFVTKYVQVILTKKTIGKNKHFGDADWIVEEKDEMEKRNGVQLKKNAHLFWRCQFKEWQETELKWWADQQFKIVIIATIVQVCII